MSAVLSSVGQPIGNVFYDLTDDERDDGLTYADIVGGYAPGDPRRYGVTGDGVTDDTAALIVTLTVGGDISIPNGNYFIAGAGADAGGVAAEIVRSVRVTCHVNARFFTDSLDNDMVRITVPADGTGLPADGIEFEWHGGTFDQRDQKVSTVVPFIGDYPPVNAGASATCDGLSVRGEYLVSTTYHHGIRRCLIEGVTTIAGEHWESAGGDSGIFVAGCAIQTVRNCRGTGCRDLHVYGSSSPDGLLRCKTTVEDNTAVNCFGGYNVKRSSSDTTIVNNETINCVRGVSADWTAVGDGSVQLTIAYNKGRNCGIPIRVQYSTGFDIFGNIYGTLGALLEDGSTVEGEAGCNGIELYGCANGAVRYNQVLGLQSGIAAAYPTDHVLIAMDDFDIGSTVQCTNVLVERNLGYALRSAGKDTGDANAYIENYVISAITSANFTAKGTNHFEIRADPTTQRRDFNNPVGFADGTTAAPTIRRLGAAGTGFRFGSNLIGLCANNVDIATFNPSAIAFRLLAVDDYADDAAAAGGGVVVGQLYRTGSALKMRVA